MERSRRIDIEPEWDCPYRHSVFYPSTGRTRPGAALVRSNLQGCCHVFRSKPVPNGLARNYISRQSCERVAFWNCIHDISELAYRTSDQYSVAQFEETMTLSG